MMKRWNRLVAATVAVPMLAALIPTAAGADLSEESTVQSASSDLLAAVDFDGLQNGTTGELADAGNGVKATINGTAATGVGANGSTAAQISQNFWLSLTAGDGSSLLKNHDSVTFSYDSKSSSTSQGWILFAAPNADKQAYKQEHYLGVMDQTTKLTVERYNDTGSRNTTGNVAKKGLPGSWKHVDIVVAPASTTLYIDGQEAGTTVPDAGRGLVDILGADGGVLQIGKGNWGDGEYYSGLLDNLKIYGSAHTAQQIKSDYDASQPDGPSDADADADADAAALAIPNADDIRSAITLPSKGSVYGSSIAWKSSDPNVVSDSEKGGIAAGHVTRQPNDTSVTLTATITAGNAKPVQKAFHLTVKAAVAQPKTTDYLFVHFTGSESKATDEQMYFATSQDGAHWQDTRKDGDPVLTSNVGDKGVRDPFLVRSPEGDKFYLIATDLSIYHRGGWGQTVNGKWQRNDKAYSNESTSLVVWESDDLVHWSQPRLADIASKIPGAGCAWAPEAYWDDATGQYYVYWTTAIKDASGVFHQDKSMDVYISTTRDFRTFSDPVKWIDRPDSSVIDTSMIKVGNTYYRASADGQITLEKSDSIMGDWQRVSTLKDIFNNNMYSGSYLEGPELFKYNDDDVARANGSDMPYGLMADQFSQNKGYLPFRTANLGSTDPKDWSPVTDVDFGSLKKRHGTILPVTAEEYARINQAFGTGGPADPVAPDAPGSGPIASYDFEDDSNLGKDVSGHGNEMALHDVGEHGKPGDWGSKVIQLRGGSGEYAELPQGLFDGRNEMTVEFSSKSRASSGNFFSFAVGQDQNRYLFVRLRGGSAYVAITDGSYSAEQKIAADVDTQGWHRYVLSVKANHIALYVDGELAGQVDTTVSVCDLGRNLHAYFGKSFYADDGYYNGGIDDVRVYNYAKSDLEIRGPEAAISVKDTDQVLSQDASTNDAGGVTKSIVLDYWADPAKGTKSDKRNVRFEYQIADGATVSDRNGKKITVDDLDALSDYSKPLDLRVSYDGKTADFRIGVEVLVTPVRISGQAAAAEGIGEKDPTGQEGWKFFSDPQAVAYGGKYYIFPTTDGYSGWQGHSIHVFESSDMVNWRDRGVVVDLSKDYDKMPDGRKEKAWAPGFAVRDGKFYLYFSGNGQVNVAVSDTSKGGTITSGYEIQRTKVASSIDPAVFHDPQTGKWWLSWGQGPGKYAELNDDMLGVKDGTQVTTNGTKNMREGSYITARRYNGKWTYYYSYSVDDTSSPNYHIEYATAPSMEGNGTQWTWRGTMLSQDASKGILGTGHHAIMRVPGTDDWYVVYHAFLTDTMRPRGYDSTHDGAQLANGNKRELRIARMTYTEPTQKETDAGGVPLIRTVPVTYEGVLPETTPRPQAVVSSSSGVARGVAAGDARVGDVLTAGFNEGWAVHSVQWYRDGSPVAGADRTRYVLDGADIGHRITARVVGVSTTGVLRNAQPGETGAVASTTDTLATGGFTVSAAPVSPDNPGVDGHGADADRRTPARSDALSRSGAVVSVVGVLGILALLTGLVLAIRHRS